MTNQDYTPTQTPASLLETQQQGNAALKLLLEHNQQRTTDALASVAEQFEYTNSMLERISRRLWAQNLVAWAQIVLFVIGLLIWILMVVGMFGTPALFRLLGR
jgi:uncharacterized membrane protein